MRSLTMLAVAATSLAFVACGSGTAVEPAASVPTGGGADTITTAPAPGELVMIDDEVGGVPVMTYSAVDPLPERATAARFTTTVIDSGDGPELCLGGVSDSLPPQCGGPVLDGLVMDGWAESQNGVSWGDRTVTVAWPPIDGHLTLVNDEPPRQREPVDDGSSAALEAVPEGCDRLTRPVDRNTLAAYATAHPDTTDILRVTGPDRSIAVLRVVEEHLDEVRAELSAGGAEPCLEPVRYSSAELGEAQQALSTLAGDRGTVISTASGNILNRVVVTVAVADRATVNEVAAAVADPAMLRIVGNGEILDGA